MVFRLENVLIIARIAKKHSPIKMSLRSICKCTQEKRLITCIIIFERKDKHNLTKSLIALLL